MSEEVSRKARVAKATHIEASDTHVVYVEFVLAPSSGFLSLLSVVSFFFAVAVECVHKAVPCLR